MKQEGRKYVCEKRENGKRGEGSPVTHNGPQQPW